MTDDAQRVWTDDGWVPFDPEKHVDTGPAKLTIGEIFETEYTSFLAHYTRAARAFGYSLDEACWAWNDWFGDDAQDPLVDWAMEHHPEWVFPEEKV